LHLHALQAKDASTSKLLCGGKRVGDKGFYFEPTIFEVYDNSAKIAQEEIFGPVQCVFKWKDMAEVRAAAVVRACFCSTVFTPAQPASQ
jgi:aldehyde dehydrogenase (NAD+)